MPALKKLIVLFRSILEFCDLPHKEMLETIFCNFSCLVGQMECPVSMENDFIKNSRVELFIYQSLAEL